MTQMVCFCFGYTQQDIVNDIRENGESTILGKIQKAKQGGKCQCKEKNPSGR